MVFQVSDQGSNACTDLRCLSKEGVRLFHGFFRATHPHLRTLLEQQGNPSACYSTLSANERSKLKRSGDEEIEATEWISN
jgi:hypothetical protein